MGQRLVCGVARSSLGVLEPVDRASNLLLHIGAGHRARFVLRGDAARVGILDYTNQLLALGTLNLLAIHEVAEGMEDGRGIELTGRRHSGGESGQLSGRLKRVVLQPGKAAAYQHQCADDCVSHPEQ